MATSPYSSTEETTNANRACRLLLGPCTDELRDVLRHYIPPPTLTHVLRQNISNFSRSTAAQRALMLLQHGRYTGNYNDMDITLLYTLLRNVCSIPPHSKGWGNDPDPRDVSVSASIERIRIGRNDCVHSPIPSLSNAEFNRIWSSVRSAVVVLDSFLGNNNKYENEVDLLRYETMDPINDRYYRDILLRQAAEDQTTRDMVVYLKNDVSKLKKTAIPENVRVIHDNEIKRWRENDKLYVETHSFSSMMEKVREESYITFVGVPGSGKSGTAYHIALKLQEEEDYEIVPVTELRDMVQYCDPNNAQVFIIDDVIGVLGVQNEKLNLLVDYKEKIKNPMMKKSKTLMTCRKTVYKEVVKRTCVSFLRKETNVIDLQHSDHLLSNEDKKNLFQKYGLNIFTEILTSEWLKDTSQMFPLLCRLYSKGDTFRKNGVNFFLFPFQCILEELDKMQSENKLHYATLILCMFNNKILSRNILKKHDVIFSEIKRNVLENCEVESCTDTFKFSNALAVLEGTYTRRNGDEFTFLHDRLFELTASHYGKQYPNEIVKFMSSDFIANFVKTIQQTQDSESHELATGVLNEDLSIQLPCELYPMLAKRIYRDVEEMKLYDVFMGGHLKHPDVCRAFIDVMKEKTYHQIDSLFLSIQTDVGGIFRKGRSVIKEMQKDGKEDFEKRRQRLLVDEDKTHNIRVISWVIFYGHHQILQFIENKTKQNNEAEIKLFKHLCTCSEGHQSPTSLAAIKEQQIQHEVISESSNLQSNFQIRSVDSEKHICCPRFLGEQNRLLVLGCYSKDLETVKILMKYMTKEILNMSPEYTEYRGGMDTPLTAACSTLHFKVVKELLHAGANVNKINSLGDPPLVTACDEGYTNFYLFLIKLCDTHSVNPDPYLLKQLCSWIMPDFINTLLNAGADINAKGKWHTPLTALCKYGADLIVKDMLQKGADPNILCGYETPLTSACQSGCPETVNELLQAGADINPENAFFKPLIVACQYGYTNIIKTLLNVGCDVNMQHGQSTPLSIACRNGHVNVVEILLRAGAEVNLPVYLKSCISLSTTPLIEASSEGNLKIVQTLLKWGAKVKEDYARSCVLSAAAKGGHLNVIKELLEAGLDIDSEDGHRALKVACSNGHIDLVKELLSRFSGIACNNKYNESLIRACEVGHLSLVNELLAAGADCNAQGDYTSPLVAACKYGHLEVVRKLIKSGADVNLFNPNSVYNSAPLCVSCESGQIELMQELIKSGADVNLKDAVGTPLTAAFEYLDGIQGFKIVQEESDTSLEDKLQVIGQQTEGNVLSIFSQLMQSKPDVTVCNKYGESPIYIALLKNRKDILKLLLKVENTNTKVNEHFFDVLVHLRHADVKLDDKDDIVTTSKRTWMLYRYGSGESYKTVFEDECELLNHMLTLGLNVNQNIHIYADYRSKEDLECKPLLYSLIYSYAYDLVQKVELLLEAEADVYIKVPQTMDLSVFNKEDCNPVLDKFGISVLEMTRRRILYESEFLNTDIYEYTDIDVSDFKDVLFRLKKRIRRFSV